MNTNPICHQTRCCASVPPRRTRSAARAIVSGCLFGGLLGGMAAIGHAAELYRWAESDGSITFSPSPPPEGIAYDRVDTDVGDAAAAVPAIPAAPMEPAPPADAAAAAETAGLTAPGASTVAASANGTAADTASTPGADPGAYAGADPAGTDPLGADPSVSYAPPPLGAAATVSPEGLRAGDEAGNAPGAAAPNTATPMPADITASSAKERQCRELSKRVISLERRLQSELSPEEMDNTVLYMARYQQNFDQFCQR